MAAKKQYTHIAVHTIQGHDEKVGTVEYKAGSGYTPANDDEEKSLMKSGAIRKATKADLERLAQTELTKDRSEAPDGYAAGTQPASAGGALPNPDGAEPKASTGAATPATGTRGTGGTTGNT
jgi:hypothetical protein